MLDRFEMSDVSGAGIGHEFGGRFRNQRKGRGERPITTDHYLHCIFKAEVQGLPQESLRRNPVGDLLRFQLWKYALKFYIQIDEHSVQNTHVHLLLKCNVEENMIAFLRVFPGQVAQSLTRSGFVVTDTPKKGKKKKLRLWIQRPYTRWVVTENDYIAVKRYIQKNEMEALGVLNVGDRYPKNRDPMKKI
ncbi:MAG: hypothetical protein ACK5P6_01190 [Pseudobdellovibrionaceae bacterium]|jgi:REP element-mobilizing transposase RayT